MKNFGLRTLAGLVALFCSAASSAGDYVTIQVRASAPASKELGEVDVRVDEPSRRDIDNLKKNQKSKKSAFADSSSSVASAPERLPDLPKLTATAPSSQDGPKPALPPRAPAPVPVYSTMKAASAAGVNPLKIEPTPQVVARAASSEEPLSAWSAWLVENKGTTLRYGIALSIAVVAASLYLKKSASPDES